MKKLNISKGDVFVSRSGVINTVVEYNNVMNVRVVNNFGTEYTTTIYNLRNGTATGEGKYSHINNGDIPLFDNEKYIPGFEGEYSVTDNGDVYSFKSGSRRKLQPAMNVSQRYHAEKIGYLTVWIGGNTPRIHTLVANLFIGPQPKGSHVDHINGNKHDNRVSNLRYVSPKENLDNYYRLENSTERLRNKWLLGKYDEVSRVSYSLGHLSGITKNIIAHMPDEASSRLSIDREYLMSLPTEEEFNRHTKEVNLIELEEFEKLPTFDKIVEESMLYFKNNEI